MTLSVMIRSEAEEGGYVAECPELPGCLSQGETIEDALASIREAADGMLQSMRDHGDPLPTGDMLIATMGIEVAAALDAATAPGSVLRGGTIAMAKDEPKTKESRDTKTNAEFGEGVGKSLRNPKPPKTPPAQNSAHAQPPAAQDKE